MSGTSLIVSDIFSILPIDTNIIKLINTENFNEKFHRQGKLGSGPQHRKFQREILRTKQVGVVAPTQRISTRNSTDKASWGSGFWTCGNEFNLNFDMCTQLIK